jgi:hypothetical protein
LIKLRYFVVLDDYRDESFRNKVYTEEDADKAIKDLVYSRGRIIKRIEQIRLLKKIRLIETENDLLKHLYGNANSNE